jgi:hypothetical protein
MSLPELPPELVAGARRTLLDVARRSIVSGLERGIPLEVELLDYPEALRGRRASFVTLRVDGGLRGCIGALEPTRPLVADVARNAHAAAFRDPRFPPLERAELDGLRICVSLLGPLERLVAGSRAELLAQLRPGVDGLLLAQGACRGTFLPAVWDALPDPDAFLRELEHKAGLAPSAWQQPIECFRYQTAEWGD